MERFQIILIAVYTACLLYMTIFSLIQLGLLKEFRKKRKDNKPLPPLTSEDPHPMVTIQLPLFNEMFVVERLIDNIMNPKDKLEIQVLDDSTDDSVQLAINKVNHYKNLGYNIKHIHRTDRSGYKAGALKEGMKHAEGEFIAIFDADFLPEPDFLIKAMPYFHNDKIGVVQTRWEHLNVLLVISCNSMEQQESGEELQSTKLEDGIQIH